MSNLLLHVEDLTVKFGGLVAVDKVSLKVKESELVAIIGPNGAGKTTLFNTLTGIYHPTTGSISFDGKKLLKMKPSDITSLGMARTFQNIRLFKELTVLDNVLIARHTRLRYSFFSGIFRTKSFFKIENETRREAIELLKIFNLEHKKDFLSKNLPYGEQRKLEIARALFSHPKLLLLDEPAAGMNPTETAELAKLIEEINTKFSTAIILIEHDMNLVMKISRHIYVLNYGKLIADGTPSEVQNNNEVIKAYLGSV